MNQHLVLLLALALLSSAGCARTELTFRGSSLEEVSAAVDRAWAPGASQRLASTRETAAFAGQEGDNGTSALVAVGSLGLYCPGRLSYAVDLETGEEGEVQVSIRASRWTQLLYLIPLVQRYPEREADLARKIAEALE